MSAPHRGLHPRAHRRVRLANALGHAVHLLALREEFAEAGTGFVGQVLGRSWSRR
ncbi:hypothetical protein ACWGDT_37415 [Streptomyces avermitilis]